MLRPAPANCKEKKILADAKHLGILEFVHGPTMEGQARRVVQCCFPCQQASAIPALQDFVDIFQGQGQDWLEQFWIEAGRLTACLVWHSMANRCKQLACIFQQ